jgi:hypothetical protein
MDGITTTGKTPTHVIALVRSGLHKAVTPTTTTPAVGSYRTTATNTSNPYARANNLPRFAR